MSNAVEARDGAAASSSSSLSGLHETIWPRPDRNEIQPERPCRGI